MRISQSKRERLTKRKERCEQQIEELNDLLDKMASNDVSMYMIGSRQVQRYKSPKAVIEAIEELERTVDMIDAQLTNGGTHNRTAIIPMDW